MGIADRIIGIRGLLADTNIFEYFVPIIYFTNINWIIAETVIRTCTITRTTKKNI